MRGVVLLLLLFIKVTFNPFSLFLCKYNIIHHTLREDVCPALYYKYALYFEKKLNDGPHFAFWWHTIKALSSFCPLGFFLIHSTCVRISYALLSQAELSWNHELMKLSRTWAKPEHTLNWLSRFWTP